MFYDDEYKPSASIEKIEIPEGYVRAYKLSDNDIIQFFGLKLEFEDGIFYEVTEELAYFDSVGSLYIYRRTGRSFTPEQLNTM